MAKDLASSIELDIRSSAPCRREFDFTVPAAAVDAETERATRDFAGMVNLPGFRKGHAPAAMVRKKFADDIKQELIRRIFDAAYKRVMDDKSQEILTCGLEKEPELKAGEDFKFTLAADLAPEIELGEYLKLKVAPPAVEIGDAAVQERIEFYRTMYAEYDDAEGPAQPEDMLKVESAADFELPEDAAAALKRQLNPEYLWLSEPEIIPGSIQALTGAEVGKEYAFSAAYADDYREAALAGKTVKYTVKVVGIQRKRALTDAELCEKTRAGSMEELAKVLRGAMENEERGKKHSEFMDAIYAELNGNVPEFDLPPGLLAAETAKELRKIAGREVKSEEDAEAFKTRMEEHRQEAEATAKKELRRLLILRGIANREEITVSQQEVDSQLKHMSRYYGYNEKEFRNMLDQSGGMEDLQLDLLSAKVLDFLAVKLGGGGDK